MRRGERADPDEEGGNAESTADKIRAEIDAKYNKEIIWSTVASGISNNDQNHQEQNSSVNI